MLSTNDTLDTYTELPSKVLGMMLTDRGGGIPKVQQGDIPE